MKKILFSISFLCYFAVTSGIIINSHYCMKRLVSVHLFESTPERCGKCGMETHDSNGCCRDEVKLVKLTVDQNQFIGTEFQLAAPELVMRTPSDFIIASLQHTNVQRHFHNHSPPLLSEQDTYLKNNVFRI